MQRMTHARPAADDGRNGCSATRGNHADTALLRSGSGDSVARAPAAQTGFPVSAGDPPSRYRDRTDPTGNEVAPTPDGECQDRHGHTTARCGGHGASARIPP